MSSIHFIGLDSRLAVVSGESEKLKLNRALLQVDLGKLEAQAATVNLDIQRRREAFMQQSLKVSLQIVAHLSPAIFAGL